MNELIKNPFNHYDWIETELIFAMVFGNKKERILVGTKEGIISRLRQKGEATPFVCASDDIVCREDSNGLDVLKTTASDIAKMVTDTLSVGIAAATKNEQERIYHRAQKELPLVCDRSFDLGYLLLKFERDPQKKWNSVVEDLAAALNQKGRRAEEREKRAKEFLQCRWDTKDPVCRFAALKIWQDYCAVRRVKVAGEQSLVPYKSVELPHLIDSFSFSARHLCDAFWQLPDAEPSVRSAKIEWNDPILRLPPMQKTGENELRVWTIDGANFEIIVMSGSFYPLKKYCRLKMNDCGVKFNRCIVCGEFFTTNTRKQETCGKTCAKLRKLQTTARYRKNSKDDEVELLRNQAYQYWYNRVRKAKQIKNFPEEQMDKLLDGFEAFKLELRVNKKRATEKTITRKEFSDWVFAQENQARELMGEYEGRWTKQ